MGRLVFHQRLYFWIFVFQIYKVLLITISYTLGREYREKRNWYLRLLFTSEDRLYADLRVREQSTNMTSEW